MTFSKHDSFSKSHCDTRGKFTGISKYHKSPSAIPGVPKDGQSIVSSVSQPGSEPGRKQASISDVEYADARIPYICLLMSDKQLHSHEIQDNQASYVPQSYAIHGGLQETLADATTRYSFAPRKSERIGLMSLDISPRPLSDD